MTTLELLNIPVKNVMSTNLKTVGPNAILTEVNELFDSMSIHHMPVIDKRGRFLGMITKTNMELLKDWGTRLNLKTSMKKNEFLLNSNVACDIMTNQVMTITPETTLGVCADLFKENYFHSLPVVEDGILVGLITTFDLLVTAYRDTPLVL